GINVSGSGTLRSNAFLSGGDKMIVANASGVLSAHPIPAAQTLSTGSGSGTVNISNGNEITLRSVSQQIITSNFEEWAQSQPAGFYPLNVTTGSTGLPSELGGGFFYKRNSNISSYGSVGLFKSNSVNDKISL